MGGAGFLAVDWGTTNLRAWVVGGDGGVRAARAFPQMGVARLAPGEAARRFRDEVRPALAAEALPALMAGMVGSTLGWREAPYLDCPVDAHALADALLRVEGEAAATFIAPGLRCQRPDMDAPDVMRGEEVQLLGWLAADPAHRRGRRLACLPGTHAKWAQVEDLRIVRFVTSMTGELFDLLSTHGVLRSALASADASHDDAFEAGLAAAGDGGALASRLFTARSRVVGGGGLAPGTVRAYLSGLLVGADAAACPRLLGFAPDAAVALIGAPALTARYARALARLGAPTETVDGDTAVLDGLRAIHAAQRESA